MGAWFSLKWAEFSWSEHYLEYFHVGKMVEEIDKSLEKSRSEASKNPCRALVLCQDPGNLY